MHDYVFTLYALDAETGLDGGAGVDDLRAAMEGTCSARPAHRSLSLQASSQRAFTIFQPASVRTRWRYSQ